MEYSGDDATAYQTIRVTAPESPVAALADVEAWKARFGAKIRAGKASPATGNTIL